MFTACHICKGNGICPDKDLKFFPVVCWNCHGKRIVDEITGRPFGFESDLETVEREEQEQIS